MSSLHSSTRATAVAAVSLLALGGTSSQLHATFESVGQPAAAVAAGSDDTNGPTTANAQIIAVDTSIESASNAAADGNGTNAFGVTALSQNFVLNENTGDSMCNVVRTVFAYAESSNGANANSFACVDFDGFGSATATADAFTVAVDDDQITIVIAVGVDTIPLPYDLMPLFIDDHLLNINTDSSVQNDNEDSANSRALSVGSFASYGDVVPLLGSCTIDWAIQNDSGAVTFDVVNELTCEAIGGTYSPPPPSPTTATAPLQSYTRTIRIVNGVVIEDTTTPTESTFGGGGGPECVGIGACCVPNLAECVGNVTLEGCDAMGGMYQSDATRCADIVCPPAGACCDPRNGSCSFLFEVDCDAIGGVFQGDGVTCNPSPCELAGACCFGDECEVITADTCDSEGGCFMGEETLCGNVSSGGINLPIPEDGTTLSHTIHAPNVGTVDDMRVFVNIDHEDLSGIIIELERAGTIVTLYDQDCGANADDMRARFVDGGTPIADGCMNGSLGLDSPPGFDPVGSLSNFDGLPIGGAWTLHVTYVGSPPAGELNRWRLIFPNIPDEECIDCNMNGEEDSCETDPLYDPLIAAASDICAGGDGNTIEAGVANAGDTTAATSDAFIWCGPFFSLFDDYWAYIPRSDGQAFIAVNDFGPETFMVSVHSACPATQDNLIACSANNAQGVWFDVIKGTTYAIRVAGLNQDRGAYELMLYGPNALLNPTDDNMNGMPDECECREDVNGDGTVDALDFIQAMNEQGNCILSPPGCPSDVNEDGEVDTVDLALIINAYGDCPFPQMMMNPAFQPRSFKGEAVGDELMDSGKRR
ncbi:MAG: dockerin type I domain-containing protein [Planctomycetota bacterium]